MAKIRKWLERNIEKARNCLRRNKVFFEVMIPALLLLVAYGQLKIYQQQTELLRIQTVPIVYNKQNIPILEIRAVHDPSRMAHGSFDRRDYLQIIHRDGIPLKKIKECKCTVVLSMIFYSGANIFPVQELPLANYPLNFIPNDVLTGTVQEILTDPEGRFAKLLEDSQAIRLRSDPPVDVALTRRAYVQISFTDRLDRNHKSFFYVDLPLRRSVLPQGGIQSKAETASKPSSAKTTKHLKDPARRKENSNKSWLVGRVTQWEHGWDTGGWDTWFDSGWDDGGWGAGIQTGTLLEQDEGRSMFQKIEAAVKNGSAIDFSTLNATEVYKYYLNKIQAP